MNILRTLESIKKNIWGDELDGDCIINRSSPIPSYEKWNYDQPIEIDKIKIWEQLYHEPGNLGLFVAWSPYIECYILVFYPFLDSKNGIQLYYGKDSCYEISAIMREMSINFEIEKILEPIVDI